MQAPDEAGYVTSSRMEVYRGSTLALTVAHIGVAAGLEIDGERMAFTEEPLRSHRLQGAVGGQEKFFSAALP